MVIIADGPSTEVDRSRSRRASPVALRFEKLTVAANDVDPILAEGQAAMIIQPVLKTIAIVTAH